MREDYRDYHRTNHGGGIVEIFDHGHTFWESNGVPVVPCDECHEMKLETELDQHDGICNSCFEELHTCWDCDGFFPEETLETYEGNCYCEACMEQMVLSRRPIKHFKPLNMVDLAHQLVGMNKKGVAI